MFVSLKKNFSKILFESDLIILGSYPPPNGGVSLFNKRLLPYLDKHSINYLFINKNSFYDNKKIISINHKHLFWIYFLLISFIHKKKIRTSNKTIHFHLINQLQFIYIYLYSALVTNNILVTIHNEDFFSLKKILKKVIEILFRQDNYKIIVVSEKLYEFIKNENNNVYYLPATIFPLSYNKIDIEKEKNHVMLASCIWKFNDKQAYRYGIDRIVYLMRKHKNIKLYLFVGGDVDKDIVYNYFKNEDLYERVFIFFNKNMINYLHNFDLFIRANREDGFGVSVFEAASLNIPVIASNACSRHRKAIIFDAESVDDLLNKYKYFFNNYYLKYNMEINDVARENEKYINKILSLYKNG